MSENLNITIILLAAGNSSRLMEDKLALEVGGMTLLDRSMSSAEDSLAQQIILVTGAVKEPETKIAERKGVRLVHNPDWQKGIGSSIKAGMRDLMDQKDMPSAVIIAVCDQPHISAGHFNRLIDRYNKTRKKIIASAYAGSHGTPVLYDRQLFEELLNIPDGEGAKRHILDHADADDMEKVPFPGGEIDIDTPEDLMKARQG